MMELYYSITVNGDQDGYYHIPPANPVFRRSDEILTLCGFRGDGLEGESYQRHNANQFLPNCPECIYILRYCKNLAVKITRLTGQERDTPKDPRTSAGQAVYRAVVAGKMPHASTLPCAENCGYQATGYHHYLGYEREHWLDVIPLCTHCHLKADAPNRKRKRRPIEEVERYQCEAMTKTGHRCFVRAEKDSVYCRAHGFQSKTIIHYTEATP